MSTEDLRPVLNICLALQPYLPELVVIGGWVPALYAAHGNLDWQGQTSRTEEVDILAIPPVPRGDQVTKLETMLRSQGLKPRVESATAAVWDSTAEEGEGIEFLTRRTGPTTRENPVPLGDHGSVGAMPIDDVEIMAVHTTTVGVPVRVEGRPAFELPIRVPTLGAYVVNKAATFPKRPALFGDEPNPKQAKDLVYLRDVMAAGDKVVSRVEADVSDLRITPADAGLVAKGRSNLGLLLSPKEPSWPDLPLLAARQVLERDGGDLVGREGELRGYLADLRRILAG